MDDEIREILHKAKIEKLIRSGGNKSLLQDAYDLEKVVLHPSVFNLGTKAVPSDEWKKLNYRLTRVAWSAFLVGPMLLIVTNGRILHNDLVVWAALALFSSFAFGVIKFTKALEKTASIENSS